MYIIDLKKEGEPFMCFCRDHGTYWEEGGMLCVECLKKYKKRFRLRIGDKPCKQHKDLASEVSGSDAVEVLYDLISKIKTTV